MRAELGHFLPIKETGGCLTGVSALSRAPRHEHFTVASKPPTRITILMPNSFVSRSRKARRSAFLAVAAAVLGIVACGGGSDTTGPGNGSGGGNVTLTLTSIGLSASTVSVQVGATTTLTATPKDQNGNAMTGVSVSWSSSDTTVATVSSSGVVTGKRRWHGDGDRFVGNRLVPGDRDRHTDSGSHRDACANVGLASGRRG